MELNKASFFNNKEISISSATSDHNHHQNSQHYHHRRHHYCCASPATQTLRRTAATSTSTTTTIITRCSGDDSQQQHQQQRQMVMLAAPAVATEYHHQQKRRAAASTAAVGATVATPIPTAAAITTPAIAGTTTPASSTTATGGVQRRPSSIIGGLLNTLFALFVFASASMHQAESLSCYETSNGKTTIVSNDSWAYCALVPATMHGKEVINGSQFGLGPENDLLAAYNTAFGMSADEYQILTVCIFERYDFSRFLPIRPEAPLVEFAFRCVCNYDLCNSETTFSGYLSAIKTESFARR